MEGERQLWLQKTTTDLGRMERQTGVKDKLTLLRFGFFRAPPSQIRTFPLRRLLYFILSAVFKSEVEGHTSQDFTIGLSFFQTLSPNSALRIVSLRTYLV